MVDTGLIKNTATSQTNYDPFMYGTMQGLVQGAVNEANKGYTPYTGQRIAQLTPDELKAYDTLRTGFMSERPLYDQAQGVFNQGLGALGNASGMQTWNNDVAQQYMNPYTQQVVNNTMAEATRANQQQLNQLRSQQKLAGSFGGSRGAIGEAEMLNNNNRTLQGTLANLYSQGYINSQDQFNKDRAFSQGLFDTYGRGAAGLTSLGGANQAYRTGEAQTLQGIGSQQRGINQTNLDTAYQDWQNQRDWNKGQLQYLSGITSGNQMQNYQTGSTTAYNPTLPQQSTGQQILGGLTSGLGLLSNFSSIFPGNNKAKGGLVHAYAKGGLVQKKDKYANGGLTNGLSDLSSLPFDQLFKYAEHYKNLANEGNGSTEAAIVWSRYNDELNRRRSMFQGIPYSDSVDPTVVQEGDTPTQQYDANNPSLATLAQAQDEGFGVEAPYVENQGSLADLSTYSPQPQGSDVTIGDLFTPYEPSMVEQALQPNPLLMMGLGMLSSNAQYNPYDTWAQMAAGVQDSLTKYEDIRQNREQIKNDLGSKKANAYNQTMQNVINSQGNQSQTEVALQKALLDQEKARRDELLGLAKFGYEQSNNMSTQRLNLMKQRDELLKMLGDPSVTDKSGLETSLYQINSLLSQYGIGNSNNNLIEHDSNGFIQR